MKIHFTKLAIWDAHAIAAYIAQESSVEMAHTVLDRIYNSIESLSLFPEQGKAGRVPGTRELIVSRTPFVVSYRIAKKEIHVLALMHGARRWPESFG
ncbi:MAG: type II toxin-antitoxin system RelE/ParE family toxin [Patescibacteria group bacterium]